MKFFLLFFLTITLCAKEKEEKFLFQIDDQITQNFSFTPKVNVCSGAYMEEECDLVVAGCEPLSLRRFYTQFNSYHENFGFWKINPEHFCIANLTLSDPFIAIGQTNGSMHCHDYKLNDRDYRVFTFNEGEGFVHGAMTGHEHPKNTSISYKHSSNSAYYRLVGEIQDGSGRRKKFSSPEHCWHLEMKYHNRYTDENETLPPTAWTPYQIAIDEERLPNGNIVCYTYEHHTDEIAHDQKIPSFSKLKSITAYNATKTKMLSSLHFNYLGTYGKDGCEVVGSDGRKVVLHCSPSDFSSGQKMLLSSIETPFAPTTTYIPDKTERSDHKEGRRIKRVERPEGRYLQTEFHRHNWKVVAQNAPLGPDGEMGPINRYNYLERATEVFDAVGNKTVYRFDEKKRVIAVETYDDEQLSHRGRYDFDPKIGKSPQTIDAGRLICVERYEINNETGDLLAHKIEDCSGRIYRQTKFKYDDAHNVREEAIDDGSEEYSITRTYSTGFNLLILEKDDFGKKVVFDYKPGTNLCISEKTYEGESLKKRILRDYDDCAICTRVICDDGENCTYRKITEFKPRYKHPCFGLSEAVLEKTIDESGKEILLSKVEYAYTPFGKVLREDHYDSNGAYRFSIGNEYDDRERLVLTTDALGNMTTFEYDANNNLTAMNGPRKDQRKEIDYDRMNRPRVFREKNGEKSFLKGEKIYDKLGQAIALIDICGNITHFDHDAKGNIIRVVYPNNAIEKKKYDPLGNVIEEIDANGFTTRKKFNFRNQVQDIYYPDGSEEHFSYNPNGMLASHVDRNGASSVFKTDIFGNVLETIVYSKSGDVLKKTSATYSAFSKLSETDAMGFTTVFGYDFAGRKISEEKCGKKTEYVFDALGRVWKTIGGGVCHVKEYDLAGQVVLEKDLDEYGKELKCVAYAYDEMGNQTEIRTSKGAYVTVFDAQGQLLSKTNPDGAVTTFGYSYNNGFSKWEKNPLGKTKIVTLDCRGWECKVETRDKSNKIIQSRVKNYDKAGNLLEEKEDIYDDRTYLKSVSVRREYGPCNRVKALFEEEGKETHYRYDHIGRLSCTVKPDKTELTRSYDALGRLSTLKGQNLNYHYRYDGNDHVVGVLEKVSGNKNLRKYDGLGNLIRDEYASGCVLEHIYDHLGHRKELILPDESTITYRYHGNKLAKVCRGDFEHRYLERDLDGNLALAELPGCLGKIKIERDVMSRWREFSSPFYTSSFPTDAYDGCGNLLKYSYEDHLGKKFPRFAYDKLNQLIFEKEHRFRFDSLHHRLEKDGVEEKNNSLGQFVGCKYDLCGNMISDGSSTYTYDALDRLIKITAPSQSIEYEYDAFNRRILKRENDDESVYIWDGDCEVGSIKEDKIVELRVLGEGLGGEIGSAVLIELEARSYVPVHDYRGCIVALIDINTKHQVGSYRYSAFGEEEIVGTTLPWGFCGKRREGGLVYFGKRYYHPLLGRWLTPDPAGFVDGLNLYAYVSNNPLTRLDVHGLRERMCRHYCDDSERGCILQSSTIEVRGWELKNVKAMYENGMFTDEETEEEVAEYLSALLGKIALEANFHISQGLPNIVEAFDILCRGKMTTASCNLFCSTREYFSENPEGYIFLICHSLGVGDVRNMLMHLPKEQRDRIYVLAIAPSCYISRELCLGVRHGCSSRDFVPLLDRVGRQRCAQDVVNLRPHKDAPWFDHTIMSKTYESFIRKSFNDFMEKYITK